VPDEPPPPAAPSTSLGTNSRGQLGRDNYPGKGSMMERRILRAEKLVNLAHHDYSLEPNVTFTRDGRWVVFRSNMFGPTHVFAVEVNASKK
jgi:hypothetical protein